MVFQKSDFPKDKVVQKEIENIKKLGVNFVTNEDNWKNNNR